MANPLPRNAAKMPDFRRVLLAGAGRRLWLGLPQVRESIFVEQLHASHCMPAGCSGATSPTRSTRAGERARGSSGSQRRHGPGPVDESLSGDKEGMSLRIVNRDAGFCITRAPDLHARRL